MREAFRLGRIALPPPSWNEHCKRLHESLKAANYEIDNKRRIIVTPKKRMIRELGYSPDEMEAFMMTYIPDSVWMGGI
jgi:hypothetical protein